MSRCRGCWRDGCNFKSLNKLQYALQISSFKPRQMRTAEIDIAEIVQLNFRIFLGGSSQHLADQSSLVIVLLELIQSGLQDIARL